MSYGFIVKYKVIRTRRQSVIGKGRVLEVKDKLDDAVNWAQQYYAKDSSGNISVVQVRYTSEENLARDFSFDSAVRWASYF